jgi:hypothetical protein
MGFKGNVYYPENGQNSATYNAGFESNADILNSILTTTETINTTGDSTDRTADIQAVVDGFVGGGVVQFGSGEFYLESAILLPSNVSLIGVYGGTKFIRNSSTNNIIRNDTNNQVGYGGNSNIIIKGISFNGNYATYNSPCTLVAIGHSTAMIVSL